jgi:hypothetical protein
MPITGKEDDDDDDDDAFSVICKLKSQHKHKHCATDNVFLHSNSTFVTFCLMMALSMS